MALGNRMSQHCSVALIALLCALAGVAPAALGGGLGKDRGQAGPRWSNAGHLAPPGRATAKDCVPGEPANRADYQAGQDAWGQPVAPADLPGGRSKRLAFPVEIEVGSATDSVSGAVSEGRAARVYVDPESLSRLVDPTQDCVPSVK